MPFDGGGYGEVRALVDLSELLRDRGRWPAGFRWDYSNRLSCAMGLVCKVNRWPRCAYAHSRWMAKTFGISDGDARALFVNPWWLLLGRVGWRVGPERLARRIDRYVARRGV